ncbi:MAG: hypothetical protein KIT44_04680 [Opitutaceae bacterium]|nr:hypothetical protein [Opitutaceae bacterium]
MKTLRCLLPCLAFATVLRAFDLTAYPVATEIALGTVQAEVKPAHSRKLKAGQSGRLHLHPAAFNRAPQPQGTLWAEYEPDRLNLEREAFDIARQLLRSRETPTLRYEQARARADLADQLAETEHQAAMLQRIRTEPELAELYLREPGGEDPATLDEAVEQLNRQAGLARGLLDFVGSARQEWLETRALELKLRQQEIELQRREQESRLVLPFDGELTLLAAPPGDHPELRVESGMDLALVQDFSRLHVRITLRQPEWRLVPPERLSLRLATGGFGRDLRAAHLHRVTEEVFGREELACYFLIDREDSGRARALVGGRLQATLVAALPGPARLVPKLDLVLAHPAAFRELGWSAGLEQLVAGARLLHVGETHLAVALP